MPEDKISFVPQKKFEPLSYKKGGPGFLFIVCLIIFIISLAVYGGLFYYKSKISKEINDLASSLDRAKEAFEVSLIDQLKIVSDKIDAAKILLQKHVSPSSIFELLERDTLKSITLQGLDYSRGNIFIVTGTAPDYKSLALQGDVLEKDPAVEKVTFSGLTLGEKGIVEFSAEIIMNPASIIYQTPQ